MAESESVSKGTYLPKADKILQFRLGLGLTPEDLENEGVIDRRTLRRIEQGRAVRLKSLTALATRLGKEIKDIAYIHTVSQSAGAIDSAESVALSESGGALHSDTELTEVVLHYLNELAARMARLPHYYPEHLRIDNSEHSPFDDLRQAVHVIKDRSALDKYIAKEKERSAHQGLSTDPIAYGPRRGTPDETGVAEEFELSWDELSHRRLRRIVILGDPGFGKTWLLRHETRRLASEAIKQLEDSRSLDSVILPIFCRLSDLAHKDLPLQESLELHFKDELDYGDAICDFIQSKIEREQCVLLLDAWDEVPETKKRPLQKNLKKFERAFNNLRILLTSRIVGYDSTNPPLSDAREYEIAPFSWPKTKAFVKGWFDTDIEKGAHFIARLVLQRYKGSRKAKPPADDPMEMMFLLGGHRHGCQHDYETQAGIDAFSSPV